ncbi:MAG: hypothetical protein AB7F91_05425 [Parvularculaceae bacterium]
MELLFERLGAEFARLSGKPNILIERHSLDVEIGHSARPAQGVDRRELIGGKVISQPLRHVMADFDVIVSLQLSVGIHHAVGRARRRQQRTFEHRRAEDVFLRRAPRRHPFMRIELKGFAAINRRLKARSGLRPGILGGFGVSLRIFQANAPTAVLQVKISHREGGL